MDEVALNNDELRALRLLDEVRNTPEENLNPHDRMLAQLLRDLGLVEFYVRVRSPGAFITLTPKGMRTIDKELQKERGSHL